MTRLTDSFSTISSVTGGTCERHFVPKWSGTGEHVTDL